MGRDVAHLPVSLLVRWHGVVSADAKTFINAYDSSE